VRIALYCEYCRFLYYLSVALHIAGRYYHASFLLIACLLNSGCGREQPMRHWKSSSLSLVTPLTQAGSPLPQFATYFLLQRLSFTTNRRPSASVPQSAWGQMHCPVFTCPCPRHGMLEMPWLVVMVVLMAQVHPFSAKRVRWGLSSHGLAKSPPAVPLIRIRVTHASTVLN
jgi:hypothetical protein